ncbi:hypothetical protein MBANPS3_001958 [Mucor bainieri]
MLSYSVQQVATASVGDQSACTKQAYRIYDVLTGNGCAVTYTDGDCRALFDIAIRNLNQDLEKCERTDYVTLCRIKPPASIFSFTGCSSVGDGAKLTKADCEAQASQDYTFYGADGSKSFYEAKNSKCINAIGYNCHNLCR